MITSPIWKDVFYAVDADSVIYDIQLDGETIFHGKAVKYPVADFVEINVNKVCSNYLDSDITPLLDMLPTTNMKIPNPEAMRTFNLYVDGVNVEDYTFWQDYSYEE